MSGRDTFLDLLGYGLARELDLAGFALSPQTVKPGTPPGARSYVTWVRRGDLELLNIVLTRGHAELTGVDRITLLAKSEDDRVLINVLPPQREALVYTAQAVIDWDRAGLHPHGGRLAHEAGPDSRDAWDDMTDEVLAAGRSLMRVGAFNTAGSPTSPQAETLAVLLSDRFSVSVDQTLDIGVLRRAVEAVLEDPTVLTAAQLLSAPERTVSVQNALTSAGLEEDPAPFRASARALGVRDR